MAIDALPKDPVMLLSFLNTRMRDEHINLTELCGQFGVNRDEIENRLKNIGYLYNEELNKFI